MARKPGKHTPYFELVDAQALAGCPICRLIYKATDRYLDGILYEAVLDPAVREKTKRSRGFCAEHVAMLRRKPGRALGIALIYRDIVRTIAESADHSQYVEQQAPFLQRLFGKGRGKRATIEGLEGDWECPACAIGKQAEEMYVELLIAHLDDEQLYTAYAQGEGLCLTHFRQALEKAPDRVTMRRLVEPQVKRYGLMLDDLDEFIRKRDHRFKNEKYGQEGDVWLRALNAIVGGAGMGLSREWGGRRSDDLVDHRR